MTDSTLEQLKERAKERRGDGHLVKRFPASMTLGDLWRETEADLDRAITIAEEKQMAFNLLADERLRINNAETVQERDDARAAVLQLRDELHRAGAVLQITYSAGNELARCGVSLSPDWPKIQDDAYEEVGEFLYPDISKGGVMFFDRLIDTESFEQFRETI